MDERCSVCLGDMEVPVYVEREEGETDPIVENGCTRLRCGHALHTECMVESLVSTGGKCVCCNLRHVELGDHTDLSWEQRLQFENVCLNKLKTIKRSLLVNEGIKDYKSFKNELNKKHTEFKNKIQEYKKQLREEMGIEDMIRVASKTKRDTRRNFMTELGRSTGLEKAAMLHIRNYRLDKWLFNERGWQSQAILTRGSRYGFY
jgi:hypothetical protein